MSDEHSHPAITADALFVIACPTCLGQLSAVANLAGRKACCPLCAATFVIPEPRVATRRGSLTELPARDEESPAATVVPAGGGTPAAESATEAVTAEALNRAEPHPDAGLVFQEPVKTIGSGSAAVELRRLSDEERRLRRGRRNLILLLVGAAVLIAIVVILGMPVGPR
jgi:hypothetical protein